MKLLMSLSLPVANLSRGTRVTYEGAGSRMPRQKGCYHHIHSSLCRASNADGRLCHSYDYGNHSKWYYSHCNGVNHSHSLACSQFFLNSSRQFRRQYINGNSNWTFSAPSVTKYKRHISSSVFSDPQSLRESVLKKDEDDTNMNKNNSTFLQSEWLKEARKRILDTSNNNDDRSTEKLLMCEVMMTDSGFLAVRQLGSSDKDRDNLASGTSINNDDDILGSEIENSDELKTMALGSLFELRDDTTDKSKGLRAVLVWVKEPLGYLAMLDYDSNNNYVYKDDDSNFNFSRLVGKTLQYTGKMLKIPSDLLQAGQVIDINMIRNATLSAGADGNVNVMGLPLPLEERQSIYENLHSGIRSIDTLTPIGRGQSMMIIGDYNGQLQLLSEDILKMQMTSNEDKIAKDEVVTIFAAVGENHSRERLLEFARDNKCTIVVAGKQGIAIVMKSLLFSLSEKMAMEFKNINLFQRN